MDPSRASYDHSGDFVCIRCNAGDVVAVSNVVIQDRDPTTTSKLWSTSVGSFVFGVMTLIFAAVGTLYVFIAPLAVVAGVATAWRLLRDPTSKKNIGAGRPIALGLCVLGALTGLLATLIGIVSLLMAF